MSSKRRLWWPMFLLAVGTVGTGVYLALLRPPMLPEDARFTRNFLVVAPGLIVYQRLLDAFRGKMREGKPDWVTSDLARYRDLFVPDVYRDEVFRFVQGNVCPKDEVGVKVRLDDVLDLEPLRARFVDVLVHVASRVHDGRFAFRADHVRRLRETTERSSTGSERVSRSGPLDPWQASAHCRRRRRSRVRRAPTSRTRPAGRYRAHDR